MTISTDVQPSVAFTKSFEVTVVNCKLEPLDIHTDATYTAGIDGSFREFRIDETPDI